MSKPDIGTLFRENVGQIGKISHHQWKIVNAIMNCRTIRMGGHVYSCPSCGCVKYVYHSSSVEDVP